MRSSLFVVVLTSLPLAAACSAFTGVDSDGLVTSGDGGTSSDGGRRDSGTRDSGSRDSGTGPHPDGGTIESMGPQCTTLQSCCDFLDTTTAATCRSTALAEDETTCEDDLFTYQEEGFCSETPPPPVDSGAPPPPPVDSGLPTGYCSMLINCCSTSGDITCLTTAIGGDETACENLYLQEVLAGTCAL